MTLNTNRIKGVRAGLTLIELTVVLLVVLSLIALTFIGAQGWKKGADRAACVLNVYKVQQAVRSYAASHAYYPGQDVSSRISSGTLFDEIIGADKYVERDPVCPQEGSYAASGNTIPRVGELFLTCSLAAEKSHQPDSYHEW